MVFPSPSTAIRQAASSFSWISSPSQSSAKHPLDSSSSHSEFTLPGGITLSAPSALTTTLITIATLLVLEQWVYRSKKKHLPGKTWTIPLIGAFADSLNPSMDAYKHSWSTPLMVTSVFQFFIVMGSSNEYARKILNSPNHAEPCLVASAKKVLNPDNWVFLNGKVHADYRKGLNVLFTRRALAIYLKTQQRIYRKYFESWASDPEPNAKRYQDQFRELNMETSLRVFCGEYIPEDAAQGISERYYQITRALELVNFPFAFPGTKIYNAIQSRKYAMHWFEHASACAKKRMAEGGEPASMVDAWVKEMQDARKFVEAGNQAADGDAKPLLIREYSDREIAMVIMSFLFASQDAMTSGLTFGFQYLSDNPDVFAKVRAEQDEIRNGDGDAPLSLEQCDQMVYTRAVVKEVLRIRPPVIMVPYLTTKDFPIAPDYTVPKGTMVIPSFWNSLHDKDVYEDPEEFKPERWMPGGSGENTPPKNYIVFGSGPHRCIGQEYANMHLAAVLGTAVMNMDFKHERTSESEEMSILPTIYPKDGLRLKFTRRQA